MRLDWQRVTKYSITLSLAGAAFYGIMHVKGCSDDSNTQSDLRQTLGGMEENGVTYTIDSQNVLIAEEDTLSLIYNFRTKVAYTDITTTNADSTFFFKDVPVEKLSAAQRIGCLIPRQIEAKYKKLDDRQKAIGADILTYVKKFSELHCK